MASFLNSLGSFLEVLAPTYYLRKRLRLTVEDPLQSTYTRDCALEEIRLYSALGRPMPWLIWSSVIATVAVLLAQFYAAPPRPPGNSGYPALSDATVAALWAFAWWAGGTVVGFLFGVPRSRTTDAQAASANPASPQGAAPPPPQPPSPLPRKAPILSVNTNLEQISDWLTKILVGVGLTQLNTFPAHIAAAARYMHAGHHAVASEALAAAILLVFSALGFMFGYLGTRLQLSASFMRADQWVTDSGQFSNPYVGPNPSGGFGDPTAPTPSATLTLVAPPASPAVASAAVPPTPADFTARYQAAKALLLAGRYAQAVDAYADLVALAPKNPALLREYLWALYKRGPEWSPCIADTLRELEAVRDQADPAARPAIYSSLTFHHLYAPDAAGADAVIGLATDYIDNKKGRPAAGIFINLACALGQRFSKSQDPKDQAAALDAIRHALATDPASRDRIVDLLEGIAGEDDLAPFRNNREFRQTLGLI